MISRNEIDNILKSYDLDEIKIGVLGSHSALEVMDGAKDESIKTICICQRGRETPYLRFKRISDQVLILDRFTDILNFEHQEKLRQSNVIFVANRAFSAYLGYDSIENNFRVPVFGNRFLQRVEERTSPKNQYHLLEKSKIRYPRILSDPSQISGPSIVKVQEARRKLERAFFFVSSYEDYKEKTRKKLDTGLIDNADLKKATIEEYIIGTYFNFNFFHSPLTNETEFLGIERRLQTNLHDFTTSLTAKQQLDLDLDLQNIEIGHTPASIRESMLEKVFDLGDRFVNTVKYEYPPGIIGPLSLQSVVTKDLDIVVYDVSLRVPGNPIMTTTSPYSKYYYGFPMGIGRRISLEVVNAIKSKQLNLIST